MQKINSDSSLMSRQLADYAMAMDLMGNMSGIKTEAEVIEKIVELFSMLCSPADIIYLPMLSGRPGELLPLSSCPADREAAKKSLTALQESYAWTRSGNGFILKIENTNEVLGIIEVDGFTFPEYKQHYLNLALNMVRVLSITILNARNYEGLIKTGNALQESEATLKAILNSTIDAVLLVDTAGNILAFNETTALRLGKTKDELIGACIYDHLPPDIARSRRAYANEVISSGKTVHFEDKRNGEWIDNSIYPIFDEQGKVEKIAIYARYITERKKAEDKLEKAYHELEAAQYASLNIMEDLERERWRLESSLKEREVLLRELHHRVKNNMQIMSSLIRLQARTITDSRYSGMFKEALNRITAMSLVHEKLYGSEDLGRIGFRDYIRILAEDLFQTYNIAEGRISLKTDVEAPDIDIDKAIPLGLIINELITNSIKYAFPGDRAGEIRIAIRPVSENEVELLVADNGIGIPGALDVRDTKTLGMQLVTALVEDQLKGSIEINRDKGTEFRIKFKI